MKIDFVTIIMTMAVLWLGGMVGGFVIAYIPFTGSALIDALIIGMIQVALLGFIGLASGKLTIWTLILGGILIFIGGIVGGFIVNFTGFSDAMWTTGIVLFTQTGMLMIFGIVGKGKAPIALKA